MFQSILSYSPTQNTWEYLVSSLNPPVQLRVASFLRLLDDCSSGPALSDGRGWTSWPRPEKYSLPLWSNSPTTYKHTNTKLKIKVLITTISLAHLWCPLKSCIGQELLTHNTCFFSQYHFLTVHKMVAQICDKYWWTVIAADLRVSILQWELLSPSASSFTPESFRSLLLKSSSLRLDDSVLRTDDNSWQHFSVSPVRLNLEE